MNRGDVLVTDPIGGDVSIIMAALSPYRLSVIAPSSGKPWQELAGEADALIVNLAQLDARIVAGLRRCRVIARLGVGTNNIDLTAAREHQIVVTNVPHYCLEEVSDHALALMLSLIRKVPLADADVQRGYWDQLRYRPIRRVNRLTLGLIGYGRLAQALARKAQSLFERVVAYDPYAAADPASPVVRVELDALLAESDVVSLHVPLVRETRNMIDQQALQAMKQGAILINTSRGELVDESALVAALDSGHLSAAGLDVFDGEPLAAGSRLRGRNDVVLTPHMAFYSEESLIDLQRTAAEDVARTLAGGTPLHRVS